VAPPRRLQSRGGTDLRTIGPGSALWDLVGDYWLGDSDVPATAVDAAAGAFSGPGPIEPKQASDGWMEAALRNLKQQATELPGQASEAFHRVNRWGAADMPIAERARDIGEIGGAMARGAAEPFVTAMKDPRAAVEHYPLDVLGLALGGAGALGRVGSKVDDVASATKAASNFRTARQGRAIDTLATKGGGNVMRGQILGELERAGDIGGGMVTPAGRVRAGIGESRPRANVGPVPPEGFSPYAPPSVARRIQREGTMYEDEGPFTLHHATVAKDAVLREGLRPSADTGRLGLGPQSRQISVTYNPAHADLLAERMRLQGSAARGEMTPNDVLDAFSEAYDEDPWEIAKALDMDTFPYDTPEYDLPDAAWEALSQQVEPMDPHSMVQTLDMRAPEDEFGGGRAILVSNAEQVKPNLPEQIDVLDVAVRDDFPAAQRWWEEYDRSRGTGWRRRHPVEAPKHRYYDPVNEFELVYDPEDVWVMNEKRGPRRPRTNAEETAIRRLKFAMGSGSR
jgi:hypothetical protein